jgi:hypothetical protein
MTSAVSLAANQTFGRQENKLYNGESTPASSQANPTQGGVVSTLRHPFLVCGFG